jgi:outer membrane protein TolC
MKTGRRWCRRATLAFLLALAASAQGLWAETPAADLQSIIKAALANDPRMKDLSMAARAQAASEACWTADRSPALNLGGSPLVQAGFGTGQSTALDFGLGLGLNLKLPGEGSLSAGLSHRLAAQLDASGAAWRQTPSLSLGWQQPLFVNGKLIDPGLTGAARALQVEVPARRLAARERAVANAVVADTVNAWFNLALIAETLTLQEARIALALQNRDILLARQKLGQASAAELGKAGLDLGRLEASRIETGRARRQLLAKLSIASGGPVAVPGAGAVSTLPVLALPDMAGRRSEALAASAGVLGAEADLAESAAELAAAGRDQAPVLGLRFSLNPTAAAGAAADFAGSFAALGAEGATANPVLGLELSLPLGDGGRAAATRDLARSRNAAARERRDEAGRDCLRKLDEIEGRQDSARRKIELYDSQLAWQDGQMGIVDAQVQLGMALPLDAAQARADRAETAVERRRADLELFAANLELLDACGRSLARELGLAANREEQP